MHLLAHPRRRSVALMRHGLRHGLRWVLCGLALVLLLQGSLALMAATLGPRHSHAVALPQTTLLDLRRGVVVGALPLARPGPVAAAQPHALQRHHHAQTGVDLERDGAAQLVDAQVAAAAMLALWLWFAPATAVLPPTALARQQAPAWHGWFLATRETGALERPPRALRLRA